jgi:hypothetical protein
MGTAAHVMTEVPRAAATAVIATIVVRARRAVPAGVTAVRVTAGDPRPVVARSTATTVDRAAEADTAVHVTIEAPPAVDIEARPPVAAIAVPGMLVVPRPVVGRSTATIVDRVPAVGTAVPGTAVVRLRVVGRSTVTTVDRVPAAVTAVRVTIGAPPVVDTEARRPAAAIAVPGTVVVLRPVGGRSIVMIVVRAAAVTAVRRTAVVRPRVVGRSAVVRPRVAGHSIVTTVVRPRVVGTAVRVTMVPQLAVGRSIVTTVDRAAEADTAAPMTIVARPVVDIVTAALTGVLPATGVATMRVVQIVRRATTGGTPPVVRPGTTGARAGMTGTRATGVRASDPIDPAVPAEADRATASVVGSIAVDRPQAGTSVETIVPALETGTAVATVRRTVAGTTFRAAPRTSVGTALRVVRGLRAGTALLAAPRTSVGMASTAHAARRPARTHGRRRDVGPRTRTARGRTAGATTATTGDDTTVTAAGVTTGRTASRTVTGAASGPGTAGRFTRTPRIRSTTPVRTRLRRCLTRSIPAS